MPIMNDIRSFNNSNIMKPPCILGPLIKPDIYDFINDFIFDCSLLKYHLSTSKMTSNDISFNPLSFVYNKYILIEDLSGFLEFEKFVKDDKTKNEKSFNDGDERHHKRNILTDIADEPILNDVYNDTSFLTIDLPMHHSRGLHKTSLVAEANEQTSIVAPTTKPQTIDSTNPFEITQVKEVSNKNYTPHVFFVKFSNEIPSNIKEDEDVNLFSQNEIDNNFLHKFKVDYVNTDEIMKQNTINDVMNIHQRMVFAFLKLHFIFYQE